MKFKLLLMTIIFILLISNIAFSQSDPPNVNEVRAFQRMQNIEPDGAIGPLTQIYMNNLVGSEIPKLR